MQWIKNQKRAYVKGFTYVCENEKVYRDDRGNLIESWRGVHISITQEGKACISIVDRSTKNKIIEKSSNSMIYSLEVFEVSALIDFVLKLETDHETIVNYMEGKNG